MTDKPGPPQAQYACGPELEIPGVRFATTAAGLRYQGRDDMFLAVAGEPATWAAMFTQNRAAAAPVAHGRRLVNAGAKLRAIVVNAGFANAATGAAGPKACAATAKAVAKAVRCAGGEVLMSSTGIIGPPLPMAKMRQGIAALAARLGACGLGACARAMMTTDTRPKIASEQVRLPGAATVRICGIAKGSGMIAPNMATMLAYVFTDARVAQPALRRLWRAVVARTFNAVTIDGDTSTNDTAVIMASGQAQKAALTGRALKGLASALERVCGELALGIAQDGEGARHLVRIQVEAHSAAAAARMARRVAESPLVKTAMSAADANWGRIICALGNAGCPLDPDAVDLRFNGVRLIHQGRHLGPEAERQAGEIMRLPEYTVTVRVGPKPTASATVFTCDFTEDYVKINANYRS